MPGSKSFVFRPSDVLDYEQRDSGISCKSMLTSGLYFRRARLNFDTALTRLCATIASNSTRFNWEEDVQLKLKVPFTILASV